MWRCRGGVCARLQERTRRRRGQHTDEEESEGQKVKALSYIETMIDVWMKPSAFDARGSGVFEDAWAEYIDSLKASLANQETGECRVNKRRQVQARWCSRRSSVRRGGSRSLLS